MSFDSLINMLLIVLGFGLLIGIHELGHFLAAKWSGIRTNAFAIGMGPVVISYRKGVGFCSRSTKEKTIRMFGKDAPEMTDAELQKHGVSETEYSLRLLPIGGFVSMLGQEDGKPDSVSQDPRSYNKCPIGKRMIVVSAGVVMNLFLAIVFFLVCFQIGVNFPAPVIGQIKPGSPASEAISLGPEQLQLQAGDTVISIDGELTTSFTDIQIASAMAKPGSKVAIEVQRHGLDTPLNYSITPRGSEKQGLLEIGLLPAYSLYVPGGEAGQQVVAYLGAESPQLAAIKPEMEMVTANGEDVQVWSQFDQVVHLTDGSPITTQWIFGDELHTIEIPVLPELELLDLVDENNTLLQNIEHGLLGLCPLTKITSVIKGSRNNDVLQVGDVILKAGALEYPRQGQLRNFLITQPDGEISVDVMRDSRRLAVTATLDDGKLGVFLTNALHVPFVAQPLKEQVVNTIDPVNNQKLETVKPTSIAKLQILGGSEILSMNGAEINDWNDIRAALIQSNGTVSIEVRNPTKEHRISNVELKYSDKKQEALLVLGWTTPLAPQLFEQKFIVRSSGGSPIRALQMGFDETVNMVVMTYLTIDRLFRRSVGVDQLRGPIGIVDIGSRIAGRGMSYLLFFLAIISVNLAVLNFLPLPIVDGGLFLYLIYEKIFKKAPSIAFQNAAAVLGLGLIGMLFVVTFYNDIARIMS